MGDDLRERSDGSRGPDPLAKKTAPKLTDLSRKALERTLIAAERAGDTMLAERLRAELARLDEGGEDG